MNLTFTTAILSWSLLCQYANECACSCHRVDSLMCYSCMAVSEVPIGMGLEMRSLKSNPYMEGIIFSMCV